jgi:hypothetical protein
MDPASAPNAQFEGEITRYNRWREDLTRSVTAYHDWLEANGQLDVQQSIRFYDLLENLNKGRLMLAFLAEFSRGKSELINALFFSSFKERLLPSDVGRTTMCPTEIFHDPNEEPYLKLLSVETRYRDESISQLKNNPVEWSKIRLNTNSAADMKKALAALAETKKVYALEARMLGLSPMLGEDGELPGEEELIEVPAWRYAMINFPHPLLSNGLSILDTPGLNALGMEPELTVSTVPSAHAILFLLSIDTGVTKSDLEIWDRYVKPGLPQKIAVLNKIDLMWDELKTPAEIERAIGRMVETTSKALSLEPSRIFALSAQKALLGKIREDAGLIRKSGIEALENYLAREIVPMKRQILCRAVMNEIGAMMVSSRASVVHKEQANLASMAELQGLVGKSREVVTKLWSTISAEKTAYNAALAEYKVNHSVFSAKRSALLDMLNPSKLDAMLAQSARAMEDSWTTVGLQRAMRELSRLMSADFEQVFGASEDAKKLMQGVYNTFTEKFRFQKMVIPALDLENHRTRLQLLVHETDAFSRDPINVAHYKTALVKKFYGTLVAQSRALFTDARGQTERWVQAVTLPLEAQITNHKQQLQARLDNLSRINEKSTSISERLAELKGVAVDLKKQRDMIEGLLMRVSRDEALAASAPAVPAPATTASRRPPGPVTPPELMETTKLSTFDSPLTINRRAARAQEVFREMGQGKEPAPAPRRAPAPAPRPAAAPMISDELLAGIGKASAPSAEPVSPMERTLQTTAAELAGQAPAGASPMDRTIQTTAASLAGKAELLRSQRLSGSDPSASASGRPASSDPSTTVPRRPSPGDPTATAPVRPQPGGDPASTTQKLPSGDPLATTTQRLPDVPPEPGPEATQRIDLSRTQRLEVPPGLRQDTGRIPQKAGPKP